MPDMAQINHIRDLGSAGYSISKIHDLTSVDRKTIRKYLGMEDFSPQMPFTTSRPSMLDPLKPVIDSWLESDKNNWYKQRHTAKRVFDRLVDEHGFTVITQGIKSFPAFLTEFRILVHVDNFRVIP